LDHAAARTFFLWYADIKLAAKSLATDLMRSMANVRQRRQAELDARRLLLEKIERTDVSANHGILDEPTKIEYDRLQRILLAMDTVLYRIDYMLMLMTEFAPTN